MDGNSGIKYLFGCGVVLIILTVLGFVTKNIKLSDNYVGIKSNIDTINPQYKAILIMNHDYGAKVVKKYVLSIK